MESIQPLRPDPGRVSPEIKSDSKEAKSAELRVSATQPLDTVAISKEAEAKSIESREPKSAADQVSEQNILAQQSASHLTGLTLLGANMNISNQDSMIHSIMDGLA